MSQASLSDENSRTFSLQTKVWPTYCHHCKGGDFSSFLEKIQNMYTFSVNKSSRTSRRQVSLNIICWHDLVSTTSRLDPTRPNLNCITRYSTLACCPRSSHCSRSDWTFANPDDSWFRHSEKPTRWDWIPNVSADFNESILEDSLIKLFFWLMLQH